LVRETCADKIFHWRDKTCHSREYRSELQLIVNLLNTSYFAKDGLVRLFSVYAHPHQMSYLSTQRRIRKYFFSHYFCFVFLRQPTIHQMREKKNHRGRVKEVETFQYFRSDNEPDGIINSTHNTFSKKAGHFNFSSQLFSEIWCGLHFKLRQAHYHS
jgi:hypothetical protein